MAIKAKTIKAKNVVAGVQAVGLAATDLETILEVVRGRLDGSIEADSIEAVNLVEGLQWIAPGAVKDLADLRFRVTELEQEIRREAPAAELLKAGRALSDVTQELQAPQPDKAKIEKRLEKATKILTHASKTSEAAGRLSQQLVRWTVGAAGLWQTALKILGG